MLEWKVYYSKYRIYPRQGQLTGGVNVHVMCTPVSLFSEIRINEVRM
jgi:hypothetical protein